MATDHNVTELRKIGKKLDRVITLLECVVNNMPVIGVADINPDAIPLGDTPDAVARFKNGSYIQYTHRQVPGVIKTYGTIQNSEGAHEG